MICHKIESLPTDETIISNRPCSIYIAVLGDYNTEYKYSERLQKHTPLTQEKKRLWEQSEITVIPFIISVTGLTTNMKGLEVLNLLLIPLIRKISIIHITTIVR